jgi:hypothetical protein
MIRPAAGHLARSRRASVPSLQRYTRPGPETIARHLAATGRAARRALAKPGNQHSIGAFQERGSSSSHKISRAGAWPHLPDRGTGSGALTESLYGVGGAGM